ncbi:hypothetical protein Phum_PHUM400450 [Pediculus humanus corporis]|uniref:Uncharacterized protein n=1 Tax=Pediculus humanus subsp. corporis TaxID=121224 RepID=E0VRP3_PEDHC|nr:uncharacterized protein Phum_PHUM400450 [Pediculus humanus corporis]EEB16049.1 hypothetical protein Phum_PHUM400450 [Pediculus humanus corporis]
MGYCYELETGCSGCPVRVTVCIALCHYMLFGLFVTCFVFTNHCYPELYYVDYFFGGSGAALLLISFFTAWCVDVKKKGLQFIRSFMGLLTILAVLSTVASCFYYTITRWDDVMVTLIVKVLRMPHEKDMPDFLWHLLVVVSCLTTPTFLIYLIYIASFMCNPWKSHLFVMPYQHDMYFSPMTAPLSIPTPVTGVPNNPNYKPYPFNQDLLTL